MELVPIQDKYNKILIDCNAAFLFAIGEIDDVDGVEIKEVKQRFYNFITDKSIDLDERWDVFCKLPSYLSESYTYVQEILFTSDNEAIEIYQLMDFDTRACIKVCEIINDFTDDLLKIKVDIKLTKENILKANIKSFINDH